MNTIGDYGICKLLKDIENKKAIFANTIAIANPTNNTIKLFSLNLEGNISSEPKGSLNLGWGIERIFIPENSNKTIAEHSELEWKEYWTNQIKREKYKIFILGLIDAIQQHENNVL